MMIGTQEHYDLMAAFERDHRGYRLDRETKDLWPKGHVYQNGETNALFLAYRNGAAFAKAYHRDESSTPANPAQVTDDSPAALVNGVANEIHNLACERQNDEPLLNRLADFRSRLWAVAAAIGAGGQAVAVKPLEWYDPGNRIEYADTLLGSYKINASGSWWLDNGAMEHCGSREAAKAAAQADYKRRILSCLAAPVPATSAQVAPDGKTKENGNHVSDSNLGEPLVDSRALDGRRVAVGADTLGDYGGDRLVHRSLAQSEPPSLVAAPVPATDTAHPLNSGARHPLEAYADSYAEMSRMGDGQVACRSVEVDIRQNMIPVTQAVPTLNSGEVGAPDDHPDVIAFDAAVAAGRARIATRKPLDDDQIMEIIKEVAPWKDEPKLNDLLTYEKSPPLFPQATYDVPSYRAVRFVRAVEARLAAISAPSTPEGWRELREAFEAARYVPGDHPIVPVKIDRFMKTVERILATTPAGDGDA